MNEKKREQNGKKNKLLLFESICTQTLSWSWINIFVKKKFSLSVQTPWLSNYGFHIEIDIVVCVCRSFHEFFSICWTLWIKGKHYYYFFFSPSLSLSLSLTCSVEQNDVHTANHCTHRQHHHIQPSFCRLSIDRQMKNVSYSIIHLWFMVSLQVEDEEDEEKEEDVGALLMYPQQTNNFFSPFFSRVFLSSFLSFAFSSSSSSCCFNLLSHFEAFSISEMALHGQREKR